MIAMVVAPGDTLWAFYIRPEADTFEMTTLWGLGDSWKSPAVIARNRLMYCPGVGVDHGGRIWVAWYNGTYLTGKQEDTWGIMINMRDSAGWHGPVMVIRSAPGGVMGFPAGHSFGSDRLGTWFMGIEEQTAPLPDLYESAMYSRLDGDTWIWPRDIARGYGSPVYVDHCLPILVAHPDSGVWSVHEYLGSGHDEFWLDHVAGDSVRSLEHVSGYLSDATADSSGHLWVVYADDGGALWSLTTGGGEYVISTDVRWPWAPVCTDNEGWVWTCWTRTDSTLVVSYNRGTGWSAPELVTDSAARPEAIVSDSRGRIYVLASMRQQGEWGHYTFYRLERPGVAEGGRTALGRWPAAANIVRNVLFLPPSRLSPPSSLLSIDGRKAMDLKPGANDVSRLSPGVYFVRETQARLRAQATRKVIVAR
jgi:hypothetical protein